MDGGVIDLDAFLGEEFRDAAVGGSASTFRRDELPVGFEFGGRVGHGKTYSNKLKQMSNMFESCLSLLEVSLLCRVAVQGKMSDKFIAGEGRSQNEVRSSVGTGTHLERRVAMLRITQCKSAQQAKSYYVGGLSREEYYSEGQEIAGNWHGKGAERLGLVGKVDQEAFYALSENRDLATGARLTARINDERTIGYDFNFHVPKSVSAMYAHTKDERIVAAMRGAVGDTMREIETEMQTRVRLGGVQSERTTGNMVYVEFIHKTARPVEGKPDTHLHAHCFVFNATYDNVEERWKAGYFRDLKRDAPYFEAAFHARMADRIKEMGYGVEAKGKFWEIEGVPQSVIDKYSQRRDQIEALAEERGITDAAALDKLGASSREKKVKLSMEHLSAEWASRLTPAERAAMEAARTGGRGKETGKGGIGMPVQQALDHALTHVFERVSVASAKDVQEEALRYGVGKVTVDQVKAAFDSDPRIINRVVDGERRCTTLDVRDQERKIVAFAKETRGTLDPIKLGPHRICGRAS